MFRHSAAIRVEQDAAHRSTGQMSLLDGYKVQGGCFNPPKDAEKKRFDLPCYCFVKLYFSACVYEFWGVSIL